MRIVYAVAAALMLANVHAAAAPAEAYPGHTEEEVTEAREEFESIDTNKDGFITREEILEMDEVPEKEEIDEFFSTYDTNNDNRVTFSEILEADKELKNAEGADDPTEL